MHYSLKNIHLLRVNRNLKKTFIFGSELPCILETIQNNRHLITNQSFQSYMRKTFSSLKCTDSYHHSKCFTVVWRFFRVNTPSSDSRTRLPVFSHPLARTWCSPFVSPPSCLLENALSRRKVRPNNRCAAVLSFPLLPRPRLSFTLFPPPRLWISCEKTRPFNDTVLRLADTLYAPATILISPFTSSAAF